MSIDFLFNDTATTEIYTLSLHGALPISRRDARPVLRRPGAAQIPPPAPRGGGPRAGSGAAPGAGLAGGGFPRGARRARSEEHTSELQSRQYIVCRLLLEKKKMH